ncbi:MAG: hypothetical protein M0R40_01850 [Firmicutes bacterium]|nr:hypothetical protein [Bacillota bacterium]
MKITFFDVLGYLLKWKYLIIAITVVVLVFSYLYIEHRQHYSAEVIIKYTDSTAAEGKTPNGAKLDVYEIISPDIVLKALDKMKAKLPVESVRSSISITPIIPLSEIELQKAKTKLGEEYAYHPIIYSVRYTLSKSVNKYGDYCRDILDNIIDEYMIYFSETYLNQTRISELETGTDIAKNDYIEIAEIMDDNLKDIIAFLDSRQSNTPNFRSPTTGLSFSDVLFRYNTIRTMDMPTVFSDILNGRATLNKEVLIKKYTGRKDNNILSANKNHEQSNLSFGLMEQYVEGNKNVPNSYNTSRNSGNDDKIATIDDVVAGRYYNREKATYDILVEHYTNDGVAAIMDNIDANYCNNIINIFSTEPSEDVNAEKLGRKVESNLEKVSLKLNEQYPILDSTINDFNRYMAAQNIACLTGVNVFATIPTKLYMLISLIIAFALGAILAIAIEILAGLKKRL